MRLVPVCLQAPASTSKGTSIFALFCMMSTIFALGFILVFFSDFEDEVHRVPALIHFHVLGRFPLASCALF